MKYTHSGALWKDADPDILILKQAKAEYAKYSESRPLILCRYGPRSAGPSVFADRGLPGMGIRFR